ncbi:GH3 auxin-responsive promoter family protein [Leptotrichia sp. oral taxon 223]|uniref:GH3 auxin-responsive promoter family protein n=1 Tax=Leptotrichia sp. oral taxon 223 TaxID=712363 RepID=UPI0015BB562B|nr:GH3 auxin-responsive promoter family protein [Leptotrichia sp. oral taxon 223]NWO19306.1 GH3 auxin-responsive promoter family protein [Leptotrichia sp. oral taxon 223]
MKKFGKKSKFYEVKNLKYVILNKLFIFFCKKSYKNFVSNIKSKSKIRETQVKILLEILKTNKNTEYLKIFETGSQILNAENEKELIEKFQNKILIVNYEDIKEFVEKEKSGENNVLLSDKIKLFELTSGSTSDVKYIPYTEKFLKSYMNGVFAWIYNLYKNNKRLFLGSSYWSVSPILKREAVTSGGIRVGIEDDTSYFDKVSAFFLNKLFTVPKEIKNIQNMEDFLLITAVFLLLSENLAMISVWSPSFLMILLDFIEKNHKVICQIVKSEDLGAEFFVDKNLGNKKYFQIIKKKYRKLWEKNRSKFLINYFEKYEKNILSKNDKTQNLEITEKNNENEIVAENKNLETKLGNKIVENFVDYSMIWEKLSLVSCWADSDSYEIFIKLKEKLNPNKKNINLKFQGKGLMSTECIASFPLENVKNGSVAAHNSFFYEFIQVSDDKLENSSPKLLDELEMGERYCVVVTTNAGLYRYNTNDIVEVTGFYHKIPIVKFVGRINNFSDIVGEKLKNSFVEKQVLTTLEKNNIEGEFLLFAPVKNETGEIFYTLFLEIKKDGRKFNWKQIENEINSSLCKAFHYEYAYKLGQLGKVRVFLIEKNGLKTYTAEKSKKQKIGDIKYRLLDKNFGWENKFAGGFGE